MPTIDESYIGATVKFQDDGVPFYAPPQEMTGVIEAVKESKYHGHYVTVAVPGLSLPKLIREDQITAVIHPILTQTTNTAEAVLA